MSSVKILTLGRQIDLLSLSRIYAVIDLGNQFYWDISAVLYDVMMLFYYFLVGGYSKSLRQSSYRLLFLSRLFYTAIIFKACTY